MKKASEKTSEASVYAEADKRTRTVDLLITNFLTGVLGNIVKSQNAVFMPSARHGNFNQLRLISSYTNPYGVVNGVVKRV
jgi:hypothetical protein